jgi:hypothetical protein
MTAEVPDIGHRTFSAIGIMVIETFLALVLGQRRAASMPRVFGLF